MSKISDFSKLITKGTTPTTINCAYVNEGVNFIKVESITNHGTLDFHLIGKISLETHKKLIRSELKEDDLLITIAGALGRTYVVERNILPANTNQAVGIVRLDNSKCDPKYISYWMRTPWIKKTIGYINAQSIQKNLNLVNVGEIPVKDITVEEQIKISKVLSLIDSKIELNNKIKTELESLSMTIYEYWFVQFDFPDKNGKPYKFSGGKMVWNDKLKKEIPEVWNTAKINEYFDYLEGPGITKDKYCKVGQRFLNIKCIKDNDLDLSDASHIQEKYLDLYKNFFLQENDVVVSTSGTLGRSAIVRNCHLPLLLNTSIIRFRGRKSHFYSFMYCYLKSESFIKSLYKFSTGSIQKNIGPTHLNQMIEVFADDTTIQKFNELVQPMITKSNKLKDENQKLAQLRDWLLPMLMNGQVTVGESVPKEHPTKQTSNTMISSLSI